MHCLSDFCPFLLMLFSTSDILQNWCSTIISGLKLWWSLQWCLASLDCYCPCLALHWFGSPAKEVLSQHPCRCRILQLRPKCNTCWQQMHKGNLKYVTYKNILKEYNFTFCVKKSSVLRTTSRKSLFIKCFIYTIVYFFA